MFSRRIFLLGSGALIGSGLVSSKAYGLDYDFDERSKPEIDLEIQKYAELLVSEMYLEGKLDIGKEEISILVHDYRNNIDYVNINGVLVMPIASVIKPFVSFAYSTLALNDRSVLGREEFVFEEEGEEKVVDISSRFFRFGNDARKMIVKAIAYDGTNEDEIEYSNAITNNLFKKCGGPKGVESLVLRECKALMGGISFVEDVGTGRTYKNSASLEAIKEFFGHIVSDNTKWSKVIRDNARKGGGRLVMNPSILEGKGVNRIYKTGTTTQTNVVGCTVYDVFGPKFFVGVNINNPFREDHNHRPWARKMSAISRTVTANISSKLENRIKS